MEMIPTRSYVEFVTNGFSAYDMVSLRGRVETNESQTTKRSKNRVNLMEENNRRRKLLRDIALDVLERNQVADLTGLRIFSMVSADFSPPLHYNIGIYLRF
jgi:hypothetical protein